jgi:hypothetical protein
LFAYLDHNVLDLMTKGDPDGMNNLLRRTGLIPVFSNENLAEIQRSTGYERKFLDVLEQNGARYLVPVLDERFKHTGRAEIRQVNPLDTYSAYIENAKSVPDIGFGFDAMLQKFHGGLGDQSFVEILSGGAGKFRQLLKKVKEDLADVQTLDDDAKAGVARVFNGFSDLVEEQYRSFAGQLDEEPGSVIERFEKVTGLGPKVLNNVQPPSVVRKVWDLVEARIQVASLDLETFFGIKPYQFEIDADRERTLLEKVNAIYHQLNFLGYYRDSKMRERRRFVASFSDMTHAGLASFCHILICRDENLVMKAAAAYEYLDVGTKILRLGANT